MELQDLNFSLTKNEEVVQNSSTKEMLWSIDQLIEEISKVFTLKIGDVIFTGTPAGVGKVEINDVLKGYIGEEEVLSVKIK